MVVAVAQLVVAVTLLGAILAGIIGLIYPIPADKVNEQPYVLIPWVSFASIALGVIGWIGLLWLWGRQAQAKVAGPTRRLGAMVLFGVRTARRVRVGIRLFVMPDETKPTVHEWGEGGVEIVPPTAAMAAPAAHVIELSDRTTGVMAEGRSTADDDELTYKGKAQALYVLAEYKKAVDSAKPYRERDPETPAIWSYKCPFCEYRSYTDQGALSMLTHIDKKHADSTEGGAESEVRVDDADPPIDWTGHFWRGKQITPCAWDDYRTTSDENWNDHLETHTDPPTPQHETEVSVVPRQWAKQPIHYLGDGQHFFAGVPADPDHTLYVTEKYAETLVASGLYDRGPVEKQEHALVDAGPPPRCKCGHTARNTAWFQSHLHETGVGR
jgi:hypothetical protein